MDRKAACEKILDAKRAKGASWETLANGVGLAEVYIASCVYGENSMSEAVAAEFCKMLDLGADVKETLVGFPMKGQSLGQLVPTDPLVYRFYEIMQVYGAALKDVIQEKFGDGIMSAIDFKLDVRKEANPKGDRVVVTMNGKFLPYSKW
jgi:cyanate lyase